MRNETDIEVPPEVLKKAKELGCIKAGLYVYKDGQYGSKKFPASSIGGTKATRFGNIQRADANKVYLVDGWVAFKSPSNINNSNQVASKLRSICKAEKHTLILCKTEDIFKKMHPDYKTYLTVYRMKKYYKDAEKKTQRTFYHLTMPEKHPDIIVVEGDMVRYVIEVKWGCLGDYPSERTDLKSIFEEVESKKIVDMIRSSMKCRVIGPYIKNGVDVKDSKTNDFRLCLMTKFLVVSDLSGLQRYNPADFNLIKAQYQAKYMNYVDRFNICDIENNVDIFSSLEGYLQNAMNELNSSANH